MGIGKDFFKCLSERIGMVGFKLFVERGNAVVETVVQHADVAAAIGGKTEAVDFFLRHARGTLQDFPLLHAYGRTLRGLRHGNALMVIISAYRSQCRCPLRQILTLSLDIETYVAGQRQRIAYAQIAFEPSIDQPAGFDFCCKLLQCGLQFFAFARFEITGGCCGFFKSFITQQRAHQFQIAFAGFGQIRHGEAGCLGHRVLLILRRRR